MHYTYLDEHDLQALCRVVEPGRGVQVSDERHEVGDLRRQLGRVQLVERRQQPLDAVDVLDGVGRLVGRLRDLSVKILPPLGAKSWVQIPRTF